MGLPNHLVVFVREPRLGRVKTRLAADVGAVEAWAFYRRTTALLLRRFARDSRWRCWLAVTPDRALCRPRVWPASCSRLPQGTGDLGDRLARTVRSLPPGPVVIVGTDAPALRSGHVAQAFRALGRHDVVVGPATDGGYWLVGLRRRPHTPALFNDVRWSSAFALADTLANLAPSHSSVELEILEDVDDGAAFARWRATPARARDCRSGGTSGLAFPARAGRSPGCGPRTPR